MRSYGLKPGNLDDEEEAKQIVQAMKEEQQRAKAGSNELKIHVSL